MECHYFISLFKATTRTKNYVWFMDGYYSVTTKNVEITYFINGTACKLPNITAKIHQILNK